MGEIINLNRIRKDREREAGRKPGARHAKAGLTKAERNSQARTNERAKANLDGKQLDAEPELPEPPGKR
jgi:hypothetical protein